MDQFVSISCQHDTAAEVIADCLAQLEAVNNQFNFAFIYATDAMSTDYSELLQQCKKQTGIEHWIGSLGAGIVAPQKEYYDVPAVSIMLAKFESDEFTMLPLIQNVKDLSSVKWPKEFFTNFGIVHGDPFYQETQNIIVDIQKQVEECFLVGGLTSSKDSQYQVADKILSKGVSGVFLSENIPVLTSLSQGCSPISKKYIISKSQKNIISQLDNKPALEVLMQVFNLSDFNALKDRAGDLFMGLCVPHSDKSDYIVRNLVGIDVKQNIFAINDIPLEGNEMIFCERNEQTAVKDMQLMLDNMAQRLGQKKPKAGIYVSCLGRGRAQFGPNSEEVQMINQTLGDFPLTGFFSNGEIHHDKLYGYTGVLTLFI